VFCEFGFTANRHKINMDECQNVIEFEELEKLCSDATNMVTIFIIMSFDLIAFFSVE
jgi:hypothetical protein